MTTPDPRGGLFIDTGDGRGPIHIDDMTDAERAVVFAPIDTPIETQLVASSDAPVDCTDTPVIEDSDDGR